MCINPDTTFSLYSYVCIHPDTTLSVFLSMYQSRYNSLCILKYVSIQIQLSLKLYNLYTRTNTLVCINPDTTTLCILKYVSIQIQLALELYTLYTRTNTLVCIKPGELINVIKQSSYPTDLYFGCNSTV